MFEYFEPLENLRLPILAIGLLVFWILEGTVPLFRFDYKWMRHTFVNLALTLFQLMVALALGVVMVKIAIYTTENKSGLFYLLPLPTWAHILFSVMLLDMFGGYWIHRIEHMIHGLWRFHIVHHADTHVDVTTGLRHHPVETVFRLSAQATAVLVGGIPIGVVFLYSIISIFFAQLTHANIRTPVQSDRFVSWVFVTPRMHKVHHHASKPWTNSNYGNIFSIWDRMFGTFVDVDSDKVVYGLDSLSPEDGDKVSRMLAIPFAKQEE